MNLFGRRPLCLFCLCFLLTSSFLGITLGAVKLWFAFGVLILFTIVLIVSLIVQKRSAAVLILLFCLIGVVLASFLSYWRIDRLRLAADQYVGEQSVEMTVLSVENTTQSSSEFLTTLSKIGSQNVRYRCFLYCDFPLKLSAGDQIQATASLCNVEDMILENAPAVARTQDSEICITAIITDPTDTLVCRAEQGASWISLLTVPSGWRILLAKIQNAFATYVEHFWEPSAASLVKGFLIGDTSAISDLVMRDFRRCGVSHLMAVSGLHFSILIGVLDFFLRILRVPKQIRCVISSVFTVSFLALTGFALSACRSAFMLLMVYLNFTLQEDHDSITALFVSTFFIVLIWPQAARDMGLLMSFLATLGLLTMLPWLNDRIPYPHCKNKWKQRVLLWGRSFVLAVFVTLIANFFLLPVFWLGFGEASLSTLAVNLITSPIAVLLLPLICVALLVAPIPLVGPLLVEMVRLLLEVMLWLLRLFSGWKLSTVSLDTPWAGVLISLFTVAMALVLVLPLGKRKWLTLLPPAVFTVSFAVCFALQLVFSLATVTYLQRGTSDFLIVRDRGETVVCDISDGSSSHSYPLYLALRGESAVYIDTYLITHVHDDHQKLVRELNQRIPIEKIVIPIPNQQEEYISAYYLAEMAVSCGIKVETYESNHFSQGLSTVALRCEREWEHSNTSASVTLLMEGKEHSLYYLTPSVKVLDEERLQRAQVVLFGVHGRSNAVEPQAVTKEQKNAVWLIPKQDGEWWKRMTVTNGWVTFATDEKEQIVRFDLP